MQPIQHLTIGAAPRVSTDGKDALAVIVRGLTLAYVPWGAEGSSATASGGSGSSAKATSGSETVNGQFASKASYTLNQAGESHPVLLSTGAYILNIFCLN